MPAGATVLLCPYLTHRRPEFWNSPEAFFPERFLPEASKERRRLAYVPFGGGPRLCMGVDLALVQILLIIVMVMQKHHIRLVPGPSEEPECILDMLSRYRVRVTLEPPPMRA